MEYDKTAFMRLFRKKQKELKDSLTFYRQYNTGSYNTIKKIKPILLTEVLPRLKKGHSCRIYIGSKFNNINYQFHDLDTEENLNSFQKIYCDDPYILFESSTGRYWGILDGNKIIKNIFNDTNWLVCNDKKYKDVSIHFKKLLIRALYSNESRIPFLYHYNKKEDMSENFKKFINKINNYFLHDALELSVLKSNDSGLLLKYNRKIKLEKLNGNN